MQNRFFSEAGEALRTSGKIPQELPKGLLNLPLAAGHTPLTQAVCGSALERVLALLDANADPNALDLKGVPPLVYAAANGHAEIVSALLARGANPNLADANDRVAAHFSFFRGDTKIIESLQRAGATCDQIDSDRRSVIDYARARYDGKTKERAKSLSSHAERFHTKLNANLLMPELHSDRDFQRLTNATNGSGQAITETFFATFFIALALLVSWLSGSNWAGIATYFLCTAVIYYSLYGVAGGASRSGSVPIEPQLPGEGALVEPGSPLRAIQQVLRATTLTKLSRLDAGSGVRANVRRYDLALIAAVIAGTLVSTLVAIVIVKCVWWGVKLTQSLETEWFDGLISSVVSISLMISAAFAIFIAALFLFSLTHVAYAHLARPAIRGRILARQGALAAHINSDSDLRNGGQFAEGGIVYLRSFEFDGTFIVDGFDFELLLLTLFHEQANVFALNAEENSHGTVNLKTTDSDWKQLAHDMIEQSGQVIMIPADSQGVMDEIVMLQDNGWFNKTLFVAPPASQVGQTGRDWERMRQRPELQHLEIPPYCETGFLFRLSSHGALVEYGPLGIDMRLMPLSSFPSENANHQSTESEDEYGTDSRVQEDDIEEKESGDKFDAHSSADNSGKSTDERSSGSGASTGSNVVSPAAGIAVYSQASASMQIVPVLSSEGFVAQMALSNSYDVDDVDNLTGCGDSTDDGDSSWFSSDSTDNGGSSWFSSDGDSGGGD